MGAAHEWHSVDPDNPRRDAGERQARCYVLIRKVDQNVIRTLGFHGHLYWIIRHESSSVGVRYSPIDDMKVDPGHSSLPHLRAEVWHPEKPEFLCLNKCDHGLRIPGANYIEVRVQIALPGDSRQAHAPLPRAEAQADVAPGISGKDRVNAQRVGLTGSYAVHGYC